MDKIKYVKALSNIYAHYGILFDKVYKVVSTHPTQHYYCLDIHNGDAGFYAMHFIIVSCPCSINNCLKHRYSHNQ